MWECQSYDECQTGNRCVVNNCNSCPEWCILSPDHAEWKEIDIAERVWDTSIE